MAHLDLPLLGKLLADPAFLPAWEKEAKLQGRDGPVAQAAKIGWIDGLQALAQAGADLDLRGAEGRTPLLSAILDGGEASVEKLADLGADLTATDNEGNTALHFALMAERAQMAKLVASLRPWTDSFNLGGQSCMMLAAALRDVYALEMLADLGFDSDLANDSGETPLLFSIQHADDDVRCLRWLLARGANPNRDADYGLTPLRASLMNHDPRAAEALIQAGADIHFRPACLAFPQSAASAAELARAMRGNSAAEVILDWAEALALRSDIAAASAAPADRSEPRRRPAL